MGSWWLVGSRTSAGRGGSSVAVTRSRFPDLWAEAHQ